MTRYTVEKQTLNNVPIKSYGEMTIVELEKWLKKNCLGKDNFFQTVEEVKDDIRYIKEHGDELLMDNKTRTQIVILEVVEDNDRWAEKNAGFMAEIEQVTAESNEANEENEEADNE